MQRNSACNSVPHIVVPRVDLNVNDQGRLASPLAHDGTKTVLAQQNLQSVQKVKHKLRGFAASGAKRAARNTQGQHW